MRKLSFEINLSMLRKIKPQIVPTIFTNHQFKLIEKRFSNKIMTQSERNEFSRTVSRKMKAINAMIEKESNGVFVYGVDRIKPDRLILAREYIHSLTRKFKNNH